ncbi:MAG: hypothetical protein IPO88_22135 [Nannocystis sp.]|uniref:hypothetical protein n=1 Tax=Nannocystis sp. TaxID=1962667 RepID=UPI0024226BF4|nr:hypothetical protein [Nannocystis sp.]MBK9756142.1 hypothetical protein [Nannocystis sp.]
MRTPYPILHGLLSGLLLIACGKTDDLTAGATESGGTTGATSDEPTTNDPSAGSVTSGQGCTPGQSSQCACTNGDPGAQVCAADGKSFEPCVCEGSGTDSNGATMATTITTDPVTTGPDLTTTGPDSTTVPDTTGPDSTTVPDSTSGMGTCEDPGPEPNEVENDAIDLGDQGCMDQPANLTGVLNGDVDVDWFRFRGIDSMACGFNNPFVSEVLVASDAVRVCVFAECDQGTPAFMCPQGSQNDNSPDGRPGCCGMGNMAFMWNCMGSQNETADFYVRLDQAPADSCVDYSVDYSFAPMG